MSSPAVSTPMSSTTHMPTHSGTNTPSQSAQGSSIDLTQDEESHAAAASPNTGADERQIKRQRTIGPTTSVESFKRSPPALPPLMTQPQLYAPAPTSYAQAQPQPPPQWMPRPIPPQYAEGAPSPGPGGFYSPAAAPAPQPFYAGFAGPAPSNGYFPGNNRFPNGSPGQSPLPYVNMNRPQGTLTPGIPNGAQYAPQLPPNRVIDLTGPSIPTGASGISTPGGQQRDSRKDVVCIGQLTVTALVLYPIPYICTPLGHHNANSNFTFHDDYVPVRLRYDKPGNSRNARASAREETIHIMAPIYKGANGEQSGGEEFGVVEQRVATVLGPMMARVLVRLESTVKRAHQPNVAILPLRILMFTPRGNIDAVSKFLAQAQLFLDHPSIPYDPSQHRDSPPYHNPHGPPAGGFRNFVANPINRWSQGVVAGKSVEVQRSQVDEVFKSLRSGEELEDTEPGPNVQTILYPHQKKALTFLLEREKERTSAGKSLSLWSTRKDASGRVRAWYNVVTQKETTNQPPECKGAILADDMGLGKTISVVALMAATLNSARVFAYGPLPKLTLKVPKVTTPELPLNAAQFMSSIWGLPDNPSSATPETKPSVTASPNEKKTKGKGKREEQKARDQTARVARIQKKSRATLIVCPLSTIVNWEDQFREHWSGEVLVVGGASGVVALPNGQLVEPAEDSKYSSDGKKGGDKIKVYVYHGAARRPDIDFLADFDAVITTYSTLATEYSKQVKSITPLATTANGDGMDLDDDGDDGDSGDDSSGGDDVVDIDEDGNEIAKPSKEKKRKRKKPVVQLTPSAEVSSPLQQIHWFRVVLDEAHSIKEPSTIASRACCDLMADRRLCLTGTPVQNKLDDVYALIKFLRFDPFDDKSIWTEFIGGPAKFGQPLGVARLQTIMKSVTLRRTKETKGSDGRAIISLPPRRDELRFLKFDENEQKVYNSYYHESKEEFSELRKKNEVMKNYVGILQKILRLRQICDHFELVQGKDEATTSHDSSMDYDEVIAAINRDGINSQRATAVFALLRESGTAQCVECGLDLATGVGSPEVEDLDGAPKRGGGRKKMVNSRGPTRPSSPSTPRPVLTRCQHLFCIECLRLSIFANWPKVPAADARHACTICSSELLPTDAVEVNPDGSTPLDPANRPRPPKKEKRQKGSSAAGFTASTKVKALLGDLLPFSRSNPHSNNYDPNSIEISMVDSEGHDIDDGIVKTVVFSQWTSMLDKIEDALEASGIRYDRLDGTMKRDERTRAMDALKNDPGCEVLLVSLRAGGVGLNLTAARRVYLMDPYWNPAVENQAVDRIHRLGQIHAVTTIKYVIEDSIETRLLEVQKRKTHLANMTLGPALSKAEMQQRRLEELNELFADQSNNPGNASGPVPPNPS